MKALVRNIFTIGFASVVLLSSIGIHVNQVFCSDQSEFTYSVSLSSLEKICTCTDHQEKEKTSCCKKKAEKKKKKCCNSNSYRVEIDDLYDMKSNHVDFNPLKNILILPYSSLLISSEECPVQVEQVIHPPPNIHQDIIISIQSFLI